MKATLDKEQKRAEEIKQRDEKIQKIMNSMGNIIQGDKDKKLQREAERNYIEEVLRKDELSKKQDEQAKLMRRQKNLEIKAFLDNQVNAKKQAFIEVQDQNKAYIQQVREREMAAELAQKNQIEQTKKKALDHVEFIKT